MAKGKSSPALFEVVHGKKRFDKSATVLRTPNWWFKGRHRGPASNVDPTDVAPFDEEAAANDPTLRGLPSPTADPVPERLPEPAHYESAVADEPDPVSAVHPRRGGPFHLVLDRDRHELYLRVRYTTAIVAGFALVVVVALAYVTGRQFGRGPSAALASQSTEEVAAGPIERGVMDVGRGSGASAATGGGANASVGIGPGGVSAQPAPPRPAEASIVRPGTSTPTRPAGPAVEPKTFVDNGRRVIGRQYVIIQSYPPDKKKLAEEGCDYLVKSGIPCTVEKAPPGWPQTWFSIVGTTGFDKASGPAYDDYMTDVMRVSEKYAGQSRFNKFDPMPVKWKERG